VNYQVWTRLSVGLGVVAGYDNVSAGSDMTHEGLQGRKINWLVANKLSFSLTGGFEERQFLDSNTPRCLESVFGLA